MNVTDLADLAGAESTDRWVRSSYMNQLIFRKNRGMRYFDEDDWTIAAWRDHRALDDTKTLGKDSSKKSGSTTDTIIGVGYLSVLIIFMLVYLT
jgi:hypothetical protein